MALRNVYKTDHLYHQKNIYEKGIGCRSCDELKKRKKQQSKEKIQDEIRQATKSILSSPTRIEQDSENIESVTLQPDLNEKQETPQADNSKQ